ncbi:hypothetical protein BH23PLA1_BH23PLA1_25700 [soil metagenome]
MNPTTQRQFDRLLRQMQRPPRRGWRLATSPISFGIGLAVGFVLLTQLVPNVWQTMLPGGLDQARMLRGWPSLLWQASLFSRAHAAPLAVLGTVVVGLGLILAGWSRPLRWLFWLAAALVVLLDAALIVLMLQTALRANAQAAGLDGAF